MTIDERPPTAAAMATGFFAGIAALALAVVPQAGALSGVGLVMIVLGTARGSRGLVGLGTLGQFAGVAVAGAVGLPVGLVLLALVGAVLAWDLGEQSINVAAQLGAEAAVCRPIAVHAAGSTLVGTVSLAGVYGVYLGAAGGQPLVALVALLGGGALVLLAMRL